MGVHEKQNLLYLARGNGRYGKEINLKSSHLCQGRMSGNDEAGIRMVGYISTGNSFGNLHQCILYIVGGGGWPD